MNEVRSQRIGGGTFFKMLLIGAVFTHILLLLILMIGVLLGLWSPTEADVPIEKWKAELFLFGYLIVGLIFVPFWAGLLWLSIYPGIWLYSTFTSMTLCYKPAKRKEENT